MSDICDDADRVRQLIDGGVTFGSRKSVQREKKPCGKCGERPVTRPFGNRGQEIMECPGCLRQTAPFKSRQALLEAWNGMH